MENNNNWEIITNIQYFIENNLPGADPLLKRIDTLIDQKIIFPQEIVPMDTDIKLLYAKTTYYAIRNPFNTLIRQN